MHAGRALAALLLLASPAWAASAADASWTGSWEWKSPRVLGDTTALVRFELSGPAECRARMAVEGVTMYPDVRQLFLLRDADGEVHQAFGWDGLPARAHAAGVDTGADVTGPRGMGGPWGHAWTVTTAFPPGPLEMTLFAEDLAPTRSSLAEDASVLLRLACDAPFRVVGAEGSHEAMVFGGGLGDEGAGAFAYGQLAAGVGDGKARAFTAPRVEAHGAWAGVGVGRAFIETPEGRVETPLWPEPDEVQDWRAMGGPGAWRVGVDHYAATGTPWLVLAAGGFAPLASLADLENAPESPDA